MQNGHEYFADWMSSVRGMSATMARSEKNVAFAI
jgi:hypothetical protein